MEFASNELVRMETSMYSWDREKEKKKELKEKQLKSDSIVNFINVIKSVSNCNNVVSNNTDSSRHKNKRNLPVHREEEERESNKRVKMEASTPNDRHHYRDPEWPTDCSPQDEDRCGDLIETVEEHDKLPDAVRRSY